MHAAEDYWTLACCHGLYGLGNTISCTAYLAVRRYHHRAGVLLLQLIVALG